MYGDTKPLCYVSRCKIRLPRQGCRECGTKSCRIFWTWDPVSLLVTCILELIDLSAARWIEIAPSSRSVRNRTNSSCYRFVPIKPFSQPTQRLALIVNSDRPVIDSWYFLYTRSQLLVQLATGWFYVKECVENIEESLFVGRPVSEKIEFENFRYQVYLNLIFKIRRLLYRRK